MRFRMQDLLMDVGPGFELANERCTCAASANPPGAEREPGGERERSPHPERPGKPPGPPKGQPDGHEPHPGEKHPRQLAGAAVLAALRAQLHRSLANP